MSTAADWTPRISMRGVICFEPQFVRHHQPNLRDRPLMYGLLSIF
ncbi:hypothetical protein SJ05684_c03030 [Sinorhizobium sojae CCBAU 05684]|uniref:Uncharacterized protein n=1 Tax=Sinorhizobium sojae CCBAU 05684 TaxID=716928 RepID=A0A249P760_9HYPH|nr:hypothetical protein SJ05684_c03030 [Sinorhizobium sojae CCBAU 05684]